MSLKAKKRISKTGFISFFTNTKGGIMMFAAIAIPVLLTFVGATIELNRYLKFKDYVQFAVDQAALAAASVDGQDRKAVAEKFFKASVSNSTSESLKYHWLTVRSGVSSTGQIQVRVDTRVSFDSLFGQILGIGLRQNTHQLHFSRSAQAIRDVENVDAVLTLASSGTMCSRKSRIQNNTNGIVSGDTLIALSPDPSCAHFNAMKTGVESFINTMESNQSINEFRIGMVPYNFKVRFPNTNSIPATVTSNEVAQFYRDMSFEVIAEPITAMLPLTSNLSVARNYLRSQLTQSVNGRAWARSDLGTHAGALMLDPTKTQFFPGGQRPYDFGVANHKKVLIIMTDGANVGCCFTNFPLGNFANQYVYNYEPYNNAQIEICRELHKVGVTVFSIIFDVNETDPGGAATHNVFARCATNYQGLHGDDSGKQLKCSDRPNSCFEVATDDDLIRAYQQIAQTFYKPRLEAPTQFYE